MGQKVVDLIKWWTDYAARSGGELNNNPSPGNKAGGLTTILEKSLGAVAKGGTSTLWDVRRYAERVDRKGFVFMNAPGFDPVAVTGQVAGGATILCFTTGRGSAYGCKPSPSIELATNSDLYRQMEEDMDVNCGDILDDVTIDEKGREILEKILRVASGERSKSELLGYGTSELEISSATERSSSSTVADLASTIEGAEGPHLAGIFRPESARYGAVPGSNLLQPKNIANARIWSAS